MAAAPIRELSRSRGVPAIPIGVALALGAACGAGGTTGECGAKCDGSGGIDAELEGRDDPIAQWLRTQPVDEFGIFEADYRSVLEGIAEIQGCSPDQTQTFVVSDDLVASEPFPRLVSTVCAGTDKVTDFFIALSFEEVDSGDRPTGNIDTRAIEMFAWDQDAGTYRFYATEPVFDSEAEVELEVEPARCRECHLTPSNLPALEMRMTPIMNELTQPWTHWNAAPGFPSHNFEMADRALEGNYPGLATGCERSDGTGGPCSASEFEKVVRKAHDRVALTRVRGIFGEPELDKVMSLLRPTFCAEQVNYASEDFSSGKILNAALVDPGMRNMFKQTRASDWSYAWVNDRTMRLPTPEEGEDLLVQVPVRGNADVRYENQLVTLRGLTAHQVLQVRALDWKRPVFSEFRCNMWRDALARFRSEPPDLSEFGATSAAMQSVLSEILAIGGVPIDSGENDTVIALGRATPAHLDALEAALADGAVAEASCEADGTGFCAVGLDALGEMVQAHVDAILDGAAPRASLFDARDRRICHVTDEVSADPTRFTAGLAGRYANRPSLPDVACP